MDTSKWVKTNWRWKDELRNSTPTSLPAGLPTQENSSSLEKVRSNAYQSFKGSQPRQAQASRDHHNGYGESSPPRPIMAKSTRKSRSVLTELETIPESLESKGNKNIEFIMNPIYIPPTRSILRQKDLGRAVEERTRTDYVRLVTEKNLKNLAFSKMIDSTKSQNQGTLHKDFPETDDQILEAIELQDKLVEQASRRKSKSAKLTLVHFMAAILLMLVLMLPINLADPINSAALFNKNQKMDKLISKNQIGYHFKKVVREVAQELFVSRRLDVSTLFLGVHVMKHTSTDVTNFCQHLGEGDIGSNNKESYSHYLYVKSPALASFPEAKARCEARNLQLPEVYSTFQLDQLSTFLRANNLSKCFAGLQPDILDATFRFISTGFPIWKTPHKHANQKDGKALPLEGIMDDFNVKYLYGDDLKLYAYFTYPHIITNPNFTLGDYKYRDTVKAHTQIVSPIVCETKWDGLAYENIKVDNRDIFDIKVESLQKRSVDSGTSNKGYSRLTTSTTLKDYCISIASQASDVYNEMSVKLTNLLSLVDISVQLENSQIQKSKREFSEVYSSPLGDDLLDGKHRQKRFAFLAKFIFSTGVKLIWNLFGFVQKMRMEKKIKRIENSLTNTQRQVKDNYEAVQNMSVVVASNSMAIDQLQITTADLTQRMAKLENKVDTLNSQVIGIANQQENLVKLALVANLIDRIQQSMNTGYDTLKDIIHCSLLGQTSPLLLPTDQIELVQAEVRKVSTGVLDTDFVKMQSIIVSDPADPHLLLVVINVAALSRREGELVKLVPIPQYEGEMALSPVLDYDTIIIDQLAQKYFILSEQEEYDCLFSRCYISDVERPIDQKSCGIPQLFDQQLEACTFESNLANGGDGVYIKPMLPDGILFAFKSEVATQLFCKDNSEIGGIRKLSGAGIMQLPNGCILSVTDKLGKNTKVRGQPLYRAIAAEDITLVMNGPLTAIQASSNLNDTQRRKTAEGLITSHLLPVVQHVKNVDAKVEHQSQFIWILCGMLGLAGVIILMIILTFFKSFKQFFRKIYDLRERFANIAEQILTIRELRARLTRRHSPPVFPMLSNPIFSPRQNHRPSTSDRILESVEDVTPYTSMDNIAPCPAPRNLVENRTYHSFRGEGFGRVPTSDPRPDSSQPLLDQVELDRQTKEVRELCGKYRRVRENEDESNV